MTGFKIQGHKCQGADAATPSYGYCAAHNTHYFGYKIHAACTHHSVLKTFDISNAATHDMTPIA